MNLTELNLIAEAYDVLGAEYGESYSAASFADLFCGPGELAADYSVTGAENSPVDLKAAYAFALAVGEGDAERAATAVARALICLSYPAPAGGPIATLASEADPRYFRAAE